MIAIDVRRIGTVMRTMMRRRVEYGFQGSQRAHKFGVNPELVEQPDRFHGHNHDWSEAEDRQPQPVETHEAASPSLAKRGGVVVLLRRMVHDVGSPEDPALVADAVKPVIAGFVAKKEEHPLIAEVKNSKPVQPGEHREREDFREEVDGDPAEAHADAGSRVVHLIDLRAS
jgi:hypothetical protein